MDHSYPYIASLTREPFLFYEMRSTAKLICLYAMMKQSRLVWEFMLTVIGEKYRLRDTSFGKIDLNTFFMRLQEQNDTVASWSDSTVTKLKQIMCMNSRLVIVQLLPIWNSV